MHWCILCNVRLKKVRTNKHLLMTTLDVTAAACCCNGRSLHGFAIICRQLCKIVLERGVKYRIGNFSIPFPSSFQKLRCLQKKRERLYKKRKTNNKTEKRTKQQHFILVFQIYSKKLLLLCLSSIDYYLGRVFKLCLFSPLLYLTKGCCGPRPNSQHSWIVTWIGEIHWQTQNT